jgi:hypothetical protein
MANTGEKENSSGRKAFLISGGVAHAYLQRKKWHGKK